MGAAAGVPAPGLLEVAQVWWDVERVPVVVWDTAGRRFDLVDPGDRANRLVLAELAAAAAAPGEVAAVLAEGLASCDFPPTGDGASREKVRRALRAAGRAEVLAG